MVPAVEYKSILVLCEGNHCRSPIAAGLLRRALGSGFRVESAGLAAMVGLPPHPEAIRLMAARGIDISGGLGCPLTPDLALAADLILVMDPGQKDWCEAVAPSARGRVFLLGHWRKPAPVAIADPLGGGPEAFLAAFETINQCVSDWVPQLFSKRRSA